MYVRYGFLYLILSRHKFTVYGKVEYILPCTALSCREWCVRPWAVGRRGRRSGDSDTVAPTTAYRTCQACRIPNTASTPAAQTRNSERKKGGFLECRLFAKKFRSFTVRTMYTKIDKI
jgi:hypothetical protein